MLCGIDEAGRGCLAGPLVVAGVVLLESIDGLNDSKVLSEKKRESLYEIIIKNSHYVGCSRIEEVFKYCFKKCLKN